MHFRETIAMAVRRRPAARLGGLDPPARARWCRCMRVPILVPAVAAAVLAGPGRAAAETAPAFQNPPLAAGDTLTGDWFGLRSTLAQAGITVRADLAADGAWLSHDGADGERRYLDQRFQATASFDTAAVGLAGGTLAATFQSIGGDDGPGQDEPLQRYSSIAAPHRDQLAELWYRQLLFDGALALKLGKADVSEDFATSAVAAPLLNRSFAYAPSIFTLPAYPDPATGLSVAVAYDGWHAKAGVYDGRTAAGEPTGPRWLHRPGAERFAIAELGASWGGGRAGSGGIAVGAWHHTATFARFDGGESDGTSGWYALLDGLLWPAPGNAGGGISGFAEGGMADAHVTRFARHLAVGVVSSDPAGVGRTGAIGAAATWVGTSREDGSGCDADELVIEGFLSYQVTAWMKVTPDVQWVSHPGGVLSATDRWTAVVRGVVTF
jgi:porin